MGVVVVGHDNRVGVDERAFDDDVFAAFDVAIVLRLWKEGVSRVHDDIFSCFWKIERMVRVLGITIRFEECDLELICFFDRI